MIRGHALLGIPWLWGLESVSDPVTGKCLNLPLVLEIDKTVPLLSLLLHSFHELRAIQLEVASELAQHWQALGDLVIALRLLDRRH